MPKTKISEFSATPGNNTDIDGINIAEGCAPSGINDAIRELMAQLKDFQAGTAGDSFNGPVGTSTAAAGAFTTLTTSSTVTHNGGTANGVAYLNGSKVLTTGSALTFDGTNLGVGIATPSFVSGYTGIQINSGLGSTLKLTNSTTGTSSTDGFELILGNGNSDAYIWQRENAPLIFGVNSAEQARLTTTGLGIGTSSPTARLTVVTGSPANNEGEIRISDNATYYAGLRRVNATDEFRIGSYGASQNITFYTVSSERARITSTGNFAIGDTGASSKLFVRSDSSDTVFTDQANVASGSGIIIQNESSTTGSWAALTAVSRNSSSVLQYASMMSLASGSGYAPNIVFAVSDSATTSVERARITSGGDVGIGTTSPSTRLQVTSASPTIRIEESGAGAKRLDLSVNSSAEARIAAPQSGSVLIFDTVGSERARITSGGALLVAATAAIGAEITLFKQNAGVSSPATRFWNNATSGNNEFVEFATETSYTARGSITYNRGGGLVAYNTTSDYRAKDIIGPVQNPGATIDALKVYEGVMKGATQSRPMLIAHEAQVHAPYAVSGVKDEVNEDGTPKFQQMDVSSLVPLLLAEIQSLRARVAALESNP